MAVVGGGEPDHLGGIHHRAAAEGDDRIGVLGPEHLDALLDHRDRRIGRDLIEDRERRSAGRERLGQRLEQAELRDHLVGDDQHLVVAKAADRLAQARARTGADEQGGLRDRQHAGDDAGGAFDGRQGD